ncbi:hypothetical protein BBC27_09595 [Acidithiobacillus ferrivorans]|uniref:Uncharacterized protein n=1 Tax=Acidithiobacillus ferrivorans TaxID=160808 RepID=A0A1B9BZL2_9PROT|nr:hypothetical protein [Acidithiobacillus ferrivorans]OCB03093.1 hypothetical protein BBC27_09595 [Acidithiobacillus ferrivorans]
MTVTIEAALTAELWTPPPASEEPPLPSDTLRFAAWLMKSRGDPYWNPDLSKIDQGMPAWQAEMVRLIDVYQRSGGMDDARRAAIHHAKLMHRRLLDLGYPVSVEMDVAAFTWWMTHRKAWSVKSSAVA